MSTHVIVPVLTFATGTCPSTFEGCVDFAALLLILLPLLLA